MEVCGQFYVPTVLSPEKQSLGTRWIIGWVGPRGCLDAVAKRKNPFHYRHSEPHSSSSYPSPYTNGATLVSIILRDLMHSAQYQLWMNHCCSDPAAMIDVLIGPHCLLPLKTNTVRTVKWADVNVLCHLSLDITENARFLLQNRMQSNFGTMNAFWNDYG
jgi:hypothetical protein